MTRNADSILRLRLGVAAAALLGLIASARPAVAGPHVDPAMKPEARPAETPAAGTTAARPATAPPACPSVATPSKPKAAKTPPPPAGEPLPFFGPRGALAPHVV